MGHLDHHDVVKLLAGESAGGWTARHAAECRHCAGRIQALRSARAALVLYSGLPGAAGTDCLDELEIATLADGASGATDRTAALAHVSSCVRCRVAVSSVAKAVVAPELEPELRAPTDRRGARPIRAVVPLGLGAAAVAALLFGRLERPDGADPPHREGVVTSGAAPVVIAPLGPTATVRVLRWHSVPGADMYRITLFDEQGTVLYETNVSDTLVALPSDVELEPGSPHYWIVSARTGFDRWDTSALAEFSTTEPGR